MSNTDPHRTSTDNDLLWLDFYDNGVLTGTVYLPADTKICEIGCMCPKCRGRAIVARSCNPLELAAEMPGEWVWLVCRNAVLNSRKEEK